MPRKKKEEPNLKEITPDVAGEVLCMLDDIATAIGVDVSDLLPFDNSGDISFDSSKISSSLIKLITKDYDRENKKVGKLTVGLIDTIASVSGMNTEKLLKQNVFKIVGVVITLIQQLTAQVNAGFLGETVDLIPQNITPELDSTEVLEQTTMLNQDSTSTDSE